MPNEETGIRISRHFAGPKVLLPAFFLGLAQGAAILSLYILASQSLGYGPGILVSFWAVILPAWALGAAWWGRAIDGEGSLAPRMLALTQGLSAVCWLFWPWLLSFSGFLGATLYPWAGLSAGLPKLLAQAAMLLPLLALPAFFCGGAVPLLAEMGLKKRRRLEWNLPLIGGFRLFGLAAGFAIAAFAKFPQGHILWAALGVNILLALIIPFVGDKPEPDEYEGEKSGSRLWPSRSLGLWSGEAINVLDHDLTKTAARPAWLVTFLSALALCGFLSLWAETFGFIGVQAPYDSNLWWIYLPVLMALGGLVIAAQLARYGSPSTVLALAGFLTLFGLFFAPWLLDTLTPAETEEFFGRPEFLAFLWPSAALGALWPLAGQVFHSRRHWLASSLGLASLWTALGATAGLLLTVSGLLNFHQATILYSLIAALAAFLAVTPLVGHFVAILLWLIAAIIVLFFVRPDTFQANYLENRQMPPVSDPAEQQESPTN